MNLAQNEDLSSKIEQVHHALISEWETQGRPNQKIDRDFVIKKANSIAKKLLVSSEDPVCLAISEMVADRVLGLGVLEPLFRDSAITEIMVNGTSAIFVERAGKLEKVNISFRDNDEILQIINHIVGKVGRRIDESNPYVDARLSDGSRVNAVIPPLALNGPTLTIRRFPAVPYTLDLLLERETLSEGMANFLRSAIIAKRNILISGGTGSGKTSTLNALANCIPKDERIITIEDAAEMRIQHPHVVGLESRLPNVEGKGEISIRLLLKNALRMRPDRIIVGETRGGEALDMLQAMNTGHQGSLTTVHANASQESLLRLETMVLMADIDLPLTAIRAQIRGAIHLIIHQERMVDGTRKIVSIHEVAKDKNSDSPLKLIYSYDKNNKKFLATQEIPSSVFEFSYYGIEPDLNWFNN